MNGIMQTLLNKRNKAEKKIILAFKMYYKAVIIKTSRFLHRKMASPTNIIRETRKKKKHKNKTTHTYIHLNLNKEANIS